MLIPLRAISFGAVAILLLASSAPSQEPAGASAPRLDVFLQPAMGVVPLDGADRPAQFGQERPRPRIGDTPPDAVYSFEVRAVDPAAHRGLASAQGYVRAGQKKEIRGGTASVHVRGTVRLTSLGVANYEAELWIDGRPVASTGAMVNFNVDPVFSRPR